MDEIKDWNAPWSGGAGRLKFGPHARPLFEGTLVRARIVVWDNGEGPSPGFEKPHALVGCFGVVAHCEPEVWPTVEFWAPGGGATCVSPLEVEALPADAILSLAYNRYVEHPIGECGECGLWKHAFRFITNTVDMLEIHPGDSLYNDLVNMLRNAPMVRHD